MQTERKKEKRHNFRSISDSRAYRLLTEYYEECDIPGGNCDLPFTGSGVWEVRCAVTIGWRLLAGWGRSVLIKAR